MAKFVGIWDGAPVALTDAATISLDAALRRFTIIGSNSGIEIKPNDIRLYENTSLITISPAKLVFTNLQANNVLVDRAILDNEANLSLADNSGYKRVELSSDGKVKAESKLADAAVIGVNGDSRGFGVIGENSAIAATGFLGAALEEKEGEPIYCGVAGVLGSVTDAFKGKRAGVFGVGTDDGDGVYGQAGNGHGVYGSSEEGNGVHGESKNGRGVSGFSENGEGVRGQNKNGRGVGGFSDNGEGVLGGSKNGRGVSGFSENGEGVGGESKNGRGLYGFSYKSDGVRGGTQANDQDRAGVYGSGAGIARGVMGDSLYGPGVSGASTFEFGVYGYSHHSWAGYFDGEIFVRDNIKVGGSKFVNIDHPLEPTTKYLAHCCVESSEMLNLYSGNAVLDANGEAWVDLPHWFQALNTDFRYQLTPIGGPAPNLHIAEEIAENRFKIAGGGAEMKVSWQVTGTRNDAYAKAHPLQVEVEKEKNEKGTYLHPVEHGEPEEKGTHFEEIRRRRESLENLQKGIAEKNQKAS